MQLQFVIAIAIPIYLLPSLNNLLSLTVCLNAEVRLSNRVVKYVIICGCVVQLLLSVRVYELNNYIFSFILICSRTLQSNKSIYHKSMSIGQQRLA